MITTTLIWMLCVNIIEYVIKVKDDYDQTSKVDWKDKVIKLVEEEDNFITDDYEFRKHEALKS